MVSVLLLGLVVSVPAVTAGSNQGLEWKVEVGTRMSLEVGRRDYVNASGTMTSESTVSGNVTAVITGLPEIPEGVSGVSISDLRPRMPRPTVRLLWDNVTEMNATHPLTKLVVTAQVATPAGNWSVYSDIADSIVVTSPEDWMLCPAPAMASSHGYTALGVSSSGGLEKNMTHMAYRGWVDFKNDGFIVFFEWVYYLVDGTLARFSLKTVQNSPLNSSAYVTEGHVTRLDPPPIEVSPDLSGVIVAGGVVSVALLIVVVIWYAQKRSVG